MALFISKLRQWQETGYVSENVWTEVNALVDVDPPSSSGNRDTEVCFDVSVKQTMHVTRPDDKSLLRF